MRKEDINRIFDGATDEQVKALLDINSADITKALGKITLVGALFLAVIAILPILLGNLLGVSIQLGGTSLLIVVGVALDTTRSLDSFMTMRTHKGFLG